MGTHHNFDEKRCWSCEFFTVARKVEPHLFFGDDVRVDGKGYCGCPKMRPKGKQVSEDAGRNCPWHQRWSAINAHLAKCGPKPKFEETKQTQSRQDKKPEQNRNYSFNPSLQAAMDRADARHDQWLASLTPEERENYEAEQKKKREEETAKRRAITEYQEALKKRRAQEETIKDKEVSLGLVKCIPALTLLAVILLGGLFELAPFIAFLAHVDHPESPGFTITLIIALLFPGLVIIAGVLTWKKMNRSTSLAQKISKAQAEIDSLKAELIEVPPEPKQ